MVNSDPIDLTGLPAAYARWRSSELGRITDHIEADLILGMSGPLSGKRVLDVGCGDGVLSVRLAQNRGLVTGLDIELEAIAAAHRRAKEAGVQAEFVVGDAGALPFPSASFDLVVAIAVLCFVPDARKACAEMARVLRPGGRLVVGELGRYSLWAVRRRIAGWLGSHTWRAARFRTAGEMTALAQAVGLKVEAVRGAVYYPPSDLCARWLAPLDRQLSGLTTFGAAFIALAADKPFASEEQP